MQVLRTHYFHSAHFLFSLSPLFIFTQPTFYFHSAHATQATIIKWRSKLLCPEHLSFDRSCQYFTLPWAPGAPVSPVASSACRAAERMKRAESCKIPRSHSDRQTWRWWPCRSRCCWCWRWSRPASPCLAGVTVEVGLDDCCSPDPDSHFTLVLSSSMSLISLSASSDHRCQAVSSFRTKYMLSGCPAHLERYGAWPRWILSLLLRVLLLETKMLPPVHVTCLWRVDIDMNV